jgi:hypothetical protein
LSSILRALKKLESEPQHLKQSEAPENKYFSLAGPDHHKPGARPLLFYVGGGVACGLVLLAGWWIMHDRLQPATSSIQEAAVQTQSLQPTENAQPQTAVSDKPDNFVPTAAPETTIPASADLQQAIPGATSQPVSANPSATQVEPIESAKKEIASGIAVVPPAAANGPGSTATSISKSLPVQDKQAAGIKVAALPDPPIAETEPEIPVLHDDSIRLQSISWSQTVENRLAVISNRIVREGDKVGGYLLVTINTDDVVLRQNGEEWKLIFRIK